MKRTTAGAPPDFARLIGEVMEGKRVGRGGAEAAGFTIITSLIEVYLMGEGKLAEALRSFVGELMKRDDALRREIPPELWAALFPALNTLTHARKKAHETMAKAAPRLESTPPEVRHEQREEERREEEGAPPDAGAGVLRAGAGGGR